MDRTEERVDEEERGRDTDVKTLEDARRAKEDGTSAEERRRDAYRLR